ncbi:MAG: hypothetical protein HY078_15945 [Elusimicrobia bacterium]|nr:hypothetical protein [Elusimicrobiota bacterium]
MSQAPRLLIAASCAALCACSPRVMAVRTISPILERGAQAFYEEGDPEFAREAMASQLKLLEALLKNDPESPGLLEMAAQGFNGYSFLFLDDAQPDRARQFYLRGRDFGLRMLARNPDLKGVNDMTQARLDEALLKARSGDVPGLFWTAYGWAGWINLSKDSPDAVAGLPKVAAVMRRVQELQPGYYYGGAEIFLGSYYASLPKILGGDPAKSKIHFEAALKASGGKFLLTKTLFAQYYAVAAQDQAMFKQLNEEVLAAGDVLPEARLANEVAKMKSKKLLEKTNELF